MNIYQLLRYHEYSLQIKISFIWYIPIWTFFHRLMEASLPCLWGGGLKMVWMLDQVGFVGIQLWCGVFNEGKKLEYFLLLAELSRNRLDPKCLKKTYNSFMTMMKKEKALIAPISQTQDPNGSFKASYPTYCNNLVLRINKTFDFWVYGVFGYIILLAMMG